MAAAKYFFIEVSLVSWSVRNIYKCFRKELKDFMYLDFIFSQRSGFIEAHCFQMGCFYCLLWLCSQNISKFESQQTKGVNKIKIDRAGGRQAEGYYQQAVEKNNNRGDVLVGNAHWKGSQVDHHAYNQIKKQEVHAGGKEMRSSRVSV